MFRIQKHKANLAIRKQHMLHLLSFKEFDMFRLLLIFALSASSVSYNLPLARTQHLSGYFIKVGRNFCLNFKINGYKVSDPIECARQCLQVSYISMFLQFRKFDQLMKQKKWENIHI